MGIVGCVSMPAERLLAGAVDVDAAAVAASARPWTERDDGGEGAPEVLNLRPNQINLVYKGAAVREPTTMAQAMIQWKADVTLQGKRGGAGRIGAGGSGTGPTSDLQL